ncbi:transglycosylase SLT domain-containing protein [Frateuria aurantia]
MPQLSRYLRRARTLVWAAGAILGLSGGLPATPVHAEPGTDAQRQQFKAVWPVAQQGGDSWRSQAVGLEHYLLFPYLEAAALQHDIGQLTVQQVDDFSQRYPATLPAADLRRAFLRELARRQDWNEFLARYQPGGGTELSCFALQAHLAQGQPLDFDQDLAALWSQASLPAACDPVLATARQQGLLTPERLWQRIDRAIEAAAGGTIASLAAALPAEQQASANRLALALRDPASAVAEAPGWPDTIRERQAAVLALTRLARRDSAQADQAWAQLQSHFQWTPDQRDAIQYALALYAAADYQSDASQRLAGLKPEQQTPATRAWAARVALANQDWPAVLQAIARMPATEQDSAEWRYFKARALQASGQGPAADALYSSLAAQTTYYGFLAADHLQQNYQICPAEPMDDVAAQQQLLRDSVGLQRALELAAVGLPWQARREWNQAMAGEDADSRRQAALLAWHAGWYDRAISQFSSGPALHYYDQRFPLDENDGVVAKADDAGVDPAWAYAVIRAESAWVPDARSGADAWGLMQLVPATARGLATQNGLPWAGTRSLLDPATNISLGTRYLAQLAARYQGSPWLTSVAYNAGPQNLQRWLDARPGLAPDIFIATIPYYETRKYATQILTFAVVYDWRLHHQVQRISQRMPALNQAYTGMEAGPRISMGCPQTPAPAAPATTEDAS